MRLLLAMLTLGAGWMLLTRGGSPEGRAILLPAPVDADDEEPESWLAGESQAYRSQAQTVAGL
ncbi:hypothetical protein [Brevundimonas sp.]|uniref:hypothetical protein n=1 Tax=Brevundimonas sp. TaxID=1871086 RepID=UPI0025E1723F|nr:hypothetical protein [Brevundimonas sp.]